MYKIEFGNGITIDDAIIEGDTIFTEQKVTREEIADGMFEIKVTQTSKNDTDVEVYINEGTYENQKLITCCVCRFKPGYYMINFEPMTKADLKELRTEARLDYLEMEIEPEE